jgi:hypothetical protein
MKTLGLRMMALFLLMVGVMAVQGQGRDAEVPGDNFSLEGALELFKKSESPQEFEKMLNTQDSKVNNLDLNGDGYIDYVRVIDRNEGNVHTFTLQAVISDKEVQDVAVIALEKKSNGKAVLQIIGDEDVYGMETIIEPTQDVRVNAGTTTTQTVANVWAWPSVQYVYSPSYVVWVSPWSWTMRPVWWYHWHPVVYYRYDSYWSPYRHYYARCYSPRIVYASYIYRPYRTTSVIVNRRHETQIARYRSTHRNAYERSRSRYTDNDRYSSNERSDRHRDVRSDRPTPRTRTNDELTRKETPTRTNDRSVERNSTPVQRDRKDSNGERKWASVEQPHKERSLGSNSQRNAPVQRERATSKPERQHTAIEKPRNEHSQHERASGKSRSSERISSPEKNNRSSGHSNSHSTSGSSQSQGRGKRSRQMNKKN